MAKAKGGKREGAGRPLATATLERQAARAFIAERLSQELGPIVDKAIEQAKEGNQQARDWLSDQAWGQAPKSLDITSDGKQMPSPIINVIRDV